MATQDQAQGSTEAKKSAALNFSSVMIGSQQPTVLAEFYAKVFGRAADMNDGGYSGWQVGSGYIIVGQHSEVGSSSKEPARLMLNFETTAVKAEFERLKGLGATVIAEPYTMDEAEVGWIATLADPDGNYLQLMTPFDM